MRGTIFLLGAMLAVATPVWASHATQYAQNPVEHDDQGRSDEPDRATTSVLGPRVENQVLDLDLDGVAARDAQLPPPPGASRVLAPGCTDDSGRRPSGLCGIDTVGVGGIKPSDLIGGGVCGAACPTEPPGAYTPRRDTRIRFLDAHHDVTTMAPVAGTLRLDVNHKVADTGLGDQVGPFVAGSTAHWAWLGDWQDRNGNGVIDHLDGPDNEFVWRGGCLTFAGSFNPGPHCAVDPLGSSFVGFAYPGEHTARCDTFYLGTGQLCGYLSEAPGKDAVCWLVDLVAGSALRCLDDALDGDPLLGTQGGAAYDDAFGDRTGDPDITLRGWYYGQGWPTWYYDQSLLVAHVFVAAYGAPPGTANGVDLARARFVDVDHHRSASPVLEDLVQSSVKPAARAAFLLLRDEALPWAQGSVGLALRPVSTTTGPADDAVHPGWSHEPNTPRDVFPGAAFRAFPAHGHAQEDHFGWRNDYSAHRAAPRAWADLQIFREVLSSRALVVFPTGCTMCVVGPGYWSSANPEPIQGHALPTSSGDHARSLGPGLHQVTGVVGQWLDRPQSVEGLRFDPATLAFVPWSAALAPDGWVGDVLDITGASYGPDGLEQDVCPIAGPPRSHPWGWCHPDLDGAVDDPNQYSASSGEWNPECDPPAQVRLEPEGGTWIVPVFVWRDQWVVSWLPPYRSEIEDWTGRQGPIVLDAWCSYNSGRLLGQDAVLLPFGNVGLRVATVLAARIGDERVVDVDVYEPIGA